MIRSAQLLAALIGVVVATPHPASAKELNYGCSAPPLEVTFKVVGDHYSGVVNCGNLFSAIGHTGCTAGAVEVGQCEKTLYLDDVGLRWECQWVVAGSRLARAKFSGASLDRGKYFR